MVMCLTAYCGLRKKKSVCEGQGGQGGIRDFPENTAAAAPVMTGVAGSAFVRPPPHPPPRPAANICASVSLLTDHHGAVQPLFTELRCHGEELREGPCQ